MELVDHHQLVAEGVVGEVLCLEVLVAPLQVVLEVLMMVPKVALVLLVVLQMKLVWSWRWRNCCWFRWFRFNDKETYQHMKTITQKLGIITNTFSCGRLYN